MAYNHQLIRDGRLRRKLTQVQAALEAGIESGPTQWARYEKGKIQNPSAEVLARIAKVCRIPLQKLIVEKK